MSKIIKVIYEDGTEREYSEKPKNEFKSSYQFYKQFHNWEEENIISHLLTNIEEWAKDEYGLIDEDEKNNIEDFSDNAIEIEFMKRDIRINLIPNESIINQDFVQRIIEITERGNAIEIDKTLEILEKAYRIK